jgi:hypothetical protein
VKIRRWFSREARLLSIAAEEADPAQAIAKLARDLIDETGIASPPFRPCVLASYRDVADVRRRPMRSAARLVPEDGKLYIDVNQEHSTGKQNFSADHEVVHTLFPTYTGQAVDDPETGLYWTGTEEEQLCDIGASRLLLDPPLARIASARRWSVAPDPYRHGESIRGLVAGHRFRNRRARLMALCVRPVGVGLQEGRAGA